MKKKFPHITILGRRWFQRTYGNTYHSVTGRACRARRAIGSEYSQYPKGARPRLQPEDVTDILADLRHLCDKRGYDFGALDRSAYQHYAAEKGSTK